jgi:hypothetical protein
MHQTQCGLGAYDAKKRKSRPDFSVTALPRRGIDSIRHREESKLFSAGLAATYSPKS